MKRLLALAAFFVAAAAAAETELTVYDLLAPESHQFAITFDVSQSREGAEWFFNPIRKGSVASKERVIARATGKNLPFEVVSGKVAKSSGLVAKDTPDDAQFIRVQLPAPVPKGGETRIRIFKTYTDAASYFVDRGRLVFTRPLGIKRNVVLLPKGWELVECASPGIISTDTDGRVRVSFLNDRDDQLPVKVVARRLP